jgi:hypothetical protein
MDFIVKVGTRDAYTEEGMAHQLGVSVPALRKRHYTKRTVPPRTKMSNTKIVYLVDQYDRWLLAQTEGNATPSFQVPKRRHLSSGGSLR